MIKFVCLLSILFKVSIVTSFYLDNGFDDVNEMTELIERLKQDEDTANVQINKSDLPANYHNKASFNEKVGNHSVHVEASVDKVTDPKTGSQSVHVVERIGGRKSQCNHTKKCKSGEFCLENLLGNVCAKCSMENSFCTSDQQCCGGTKSLLCVHQQCKAGVSKGSEGTICKNSSQCNLGLCCPRSKFGFSQMAACTKFRMKGESCTDSNDFFAKSQCRCTEGFHCQRKKSSSGLLPFWVGIVLPFDEKTCQENLKQQESAGKVGFALPVDDGYFPDDLINNMEDFPFHHQNNLFFDENY